VTLNGEGPDAVEVRVGCPCPGHPHPDGDTVRLRPRLSLRAGTTIQRLIIDANQRKGIDQAELVGVLAEAYLLHGVESWTFVDDRDSPVVVTPEAIRAILLSDFALSAELADTADDLYNAAVILPLVNRASRSSPTSQTGGSTSRPSAGTPRSRKRPKRSSTSTTPTGDIETTSSSPAGGSN
jgi:hypothetical protein